MDQFTRKNVTQSKIPDPVPVEKPEDKEDCGCPDSSSSSQSGSGGCPRTSYTTGGFTLVGRNNTTGACELIPLDFIADTQDDFTP